MILFVAFHVCDKSWFPNHIKVVAGLVIHLSPYFSFESDVTILKDQNFSNLYIYFFKNINKEILKW